MAESQNVEYKESWRDEYLKWVCGFALTEFLVRKTGYRWDAVPIDNVSVENLDIESFEIFRREAIRTERMTRKDLECTNEELLNKLGLIVDGKLKRAAVLLFYRNPQRFFYWLLCENWKVWYRFRSSISGCGRGITYFDCR